MLRTLTLLLLSSAIVNAAPKMEIKIAYQKVTPLGHHMEVLEVSISKLRT